MIEGKIQDIAFGGDGVLKSNGFVVFVPFAAPDDFVEVAITQKKKSHGFGKILEIKKPGPSRREPHCVLFGTCGGCQLQHIDYPTQLEIKRKFVEDSLKRIGKISTSIPPVEPSPSQWSYRRHIRLNLRKAEQGFKAGYIATDGITHLPIQNCPLFSPIEDTLLSELQEDLKVFKTEGIEEAFVRIFKTESNEYILAFSFDPVLPENCKEVFDKLLRRKRISGLFAKSPSQEISLGNTESAFHLNDLHLHYSPFGFLQNHPEQSAKIYQEILKRVSPTSKKVLDLYCGIGITSLLLGKEGKEVIGIESHPESIRLAKKNAEINNIAAEFREGKVEDVLPSLLKKYSPTCLLVNPPRTGLCQSLLPILSSSGIQEIFYISCMPATLARDLSVLCKSAYIIEHIQLFDMFPQTTHVETLVHLKLHEKK